MQHVMLDLETWGTKPGAAIRSIGAVMFDPRGSTFGAEFYANVREEEQLSLGAHKDPNTVLWWSRQSPAAQRALLDGQVPVSVALTGLCEFWRRERGKFVWSQGSNFDTVLLEWLFAAANVKCPWLFYNTRDTRTAYQMGDLDTKAVTRQGTFHNALDDAKHQAVCVQTAYDLIGRRIS